MRYLEAIKISVKKNLNARQAAALGDVFSTAEKFFSCCRNKEILKNMQRIIAVRPIMINMETYSACNARCVFCARRKLPQTGELMPLDLFRRICSEYTAMGGGYLGISPLLADPLLDPLLLERIAVAKKDFPAVYMHLFTNGIALEKFSDVQIIGALAGLKHMDISLGGLTREGYRAMMGVDKFEMVRESLIRLGKINQRLGNICKLALHIRTNQIRETIESPVLAELKKIGYECGDIMNSFSNWGGLVTKDDLPEGATLLIRDNARCRVPCLVPMSYMMIMPDGRVLACGCVDANESTHIGDLGESTLIEIWRGPGLKDFRDSFVNNGRLYPVCRTCGYYKDYEAIFSRAGFKNFDPSRHLWECV